LTPPTGRAASPPIDEGATIDDTLYALAGLQHELVPAELHTVEVLDVEAPLESFARQRRRRTSQKYLDCLGERPVYAKHLQSRYCA
jgi:hypothetical protein